MKRFSALTLLILAAPAKAHSEHGALGWTFDPWITLPLALTALLYALGYRRLRSRSSNSGPKLRRGALLFASGWLVLAGAVVSPLHEAGEHSFTMHMIEHELIMLVAALLLVMSKPGAAILWGLPEALRPSFASLAQVGPAKSLWHAITNPWVATALQGAAMWLWHVPSLFDRALENEAWHIAQHLSFFLTALIFWWAMAHGRMGRHGLGVSAFCLFATFVIGGALGALMALSSSPWYENYAAMRMTPIGLTPTEDQQLAGLIMWIPGGVVHAGAALYFLYKWLQLSEARDAVSRQ